MASNPMGSQDNQQSGRGEKSRTPQQKEQQQHQQQKKKKNEMEFVVHRCECYGGQHAYWNNCTRCGRILCVLEKANSACPACAQALPKRPTLQGWHQQLQKEEAALLRQAQRKRDEAERQRRIATERGETVASTRTEGMHILHHQPKREDHQEAEWLSLLHRKPYRAPTTWAEQLQDVAAL